MNRSLFFILSAFLLLSSCELKPKKIRQTVLLTNTIDRFRTDVGITIPRDSLITNDTTLLPILKKKDGTLLSSQIDDLNKDGHWNTLSFICNFQPNEQISVSVEWVKPSDYPDFQRQSIDPFEENESMISGIDNPELKNDSIGILKNNRVGDSYEQHAGAGKDIMSIARSTGIGCLSIADGKTLIALNGDTSLTSGQIDSIRKTLITHGPVRSIIQIDYFGWNTIVAKVNVQQIITIWSGRHGYKNTITTQNLPEGYPLATGVINNSRNSDPIFREYKYGYSALMTHDLESLNKEYYAGMALIIPNDNLTKTETLSFSKDNSAVTQWSAILKPDREGVTTYYVYGNWEREYAGFRSADFFEQYIDYETLYLANPIQVRLKSE